MNKRQIKKIGSEICRRLDYLQQECNKTGTISFDVIKRVCNCSYKEFRKIRRSAHGLQRDFRKS